ncbi:hypothetical protein BS47DRAFT_1349173 [Hydnum rufescens UP504]|uniref:Fork-head domain-containing protein n=1 Tax=Hydnum rufescens UP504 TaxID=1448309 RepID=A0A9P6APH3_9AGAM|nr:hypothetical protein BS47DRAFT_1349173 [Hydnum rufescens UP504]
MADSPRTTSPTQQPKGSNTDAPSPKSEEHLQKHLDLPLDAGAKQGLAALRDSPPGAKPFYPYSTLIRAHQDQRMLLEDIYFAIETRFPYFLTAPPGWKNSVRHNLSLNPCFEKMPRPLTDRGKGAYWVVNDNIDPRSGVHRERKRKHFKRHRSAETNDPHRMPSGSAGPSNLMDMPKEGMPYMAPVFDQEGNRIAYAAWPGAFPPGSFPMMTAAQPRYILDPNEDEHTPEFDEDGNPIWKTIWLNELVKLRRATYDQDTNGADPDWYRAMVERVRAAFLQPDPVYLASHDQDGDGEEIMEAED